MGKKSLKGRYPMPDFSLKNERTLLNTINIDTVCDACVFVAFIFQKPSECDAKEAPSPLKSVRVLLEK